jgi:hypothetical protein
MYPKKKLPFVLHTENYYFGRELAYVHSHLYSKEICKEFKEKSLDDSVNYNQRYVKKILLHASEDRKLTSFHIKYVTQRSWDPHSRWLTKNKNVLKER